MKMELDDKIEQQGKAKKKGASRMESQIEQKLFGRMLNDSDIPFGMNFESLQLKRRLLGEDI